MTKVCPRCHQMAREPFDADPPRCPRCAKSGRLVPLLNAIPVQRPVTRAREPLGTR